VEAVESTEWPESLKSTARENEISARQLAAAH